MKPLSLKTLLHWPEQKHMHGQTSLGRCRSPLAPCSLQYVNCFCFHPSLWVLRGPWHWVLPVCSLLQSSWGDRWPVELEIYFWGIMFVKVRGNECREAKCEGQSLWVSAQVLVQYPSIYLIRLYHPGELINSNVHDCTCGIVMAQKELLLVIHTDFALSVHMISTLWIQHFFQLLNSKINLTCPPLNLQYEQ